MNQARNQHEESSKQSVKMEVTCSSKTSADFQWDVWHYKPEDATLHTHCYENLKSCYTMDKSIIPEQDIIFQMHSL
jgi:hypothetical protein